MNSPMESLRQLEGIDVQSGLSRLQGNYKMYERLLVKFSVNYENVIDELVSRVRNGEWSETRRIVHTLKGLAATLGMTSLQKISMDLEADVILRNTHKLPSAIRHLASELERVRGSIRGNVRPEESPQVQPSPTQIGQSLKALEQTLKNGNPQALNQWNLIGTIAGHETEGMALGKAIASYQFSKALTVLHGIQSRIDPGTEENQS